MSFSLLYNCSQVHNVPNEHDCITALHRKFIYFFCSFKAFFMFAQNPLKYVYYTPLMQYSIPMKVFMFGGPQSHSPQMAPSISKYFDFPIVGVSDSIEYVLGELEWSTLSKYLQMLVQKNLPINYILSTRAIITMIRNRWSVPQGYVFPDIVPRDKLMEAFLKLRFYPDIVIWTHIQYKTSKRELLTSLITNKNRIQWKKLHELNRHFFVKNWLSWWSEPYRRGKKVLKQCYCEWSHVRHEKSIFFAMEKMIKSIENSMFSRSSFNRLAGDKQSHPCIVRPLTSCLRKVLRNSPQKFYCFLCLATTHAHISWNYDSGMFLVFKNQYYWVCQKHLGDFVYCAEVFGYVPHYSAFEIIRTRVIKAECKKSLVEGHVCEVCYFTNIEDQFKRINRAKLEWIDNHGKRTFTCENRNCQRKLRLYPHLFNNICSIQELLNNCSAYQMDLKLFHHMDHKEYMLINAFLKRSYHRKHDLNFKPSPESCLPFHYFLKHTFKSHKYLKKPIIQYIRSLASYVEGCSDCKFKVQKHTSHSDPCTATFGESSLLQRHSFLQLTAPTPWDNVKKNCCKWMLFDYLEAIKEGYLQFCPERQCSAVCPDDETRLRRYYQALYYNLKKVPVASSDHNEME